MNQNETKTNFTKRFLIFGYILFLFSTFQILYKARKSLFEIQKTYSENILSMSFNMLLAVVFILCQFGKSVKISFGNQLFSIIFFLKSCYRTKREGIGMEEGIFNKGKLRWTYGIEMSCFKNY